MLAEERDKTNKGEKRRLDEYAVPPEMFTGIHNANPSFRSGADELLSVDYFDKSVAAAIVPNYPQYLDGGSKHPIMEA